MTPSNAGAPQIFQDLFRNYLVLIKGAGDLATGVAWRLHRSGFPVAMTELEHPLAVRRAVAFAQAVFDGRHTVEGITARRCTLEEAPQVLARGEIPMLVDPEASSVAALRPRVLVDGIMAKRNTGTRMDDAPLVVALGPGFSAGVDCHAVIETNRGHFLGRVIWEGPAQKDTGIPGAVTGVGARHSRVLRAPIPGFVEPAYRIGDLVPQGAVLARVWNRQGEGAAIHAPFPGVLRGLIHPSVPVPGGMKVGDLDPRVAPEHCFTISDKSLSIGGGVLEAILTFFFGGQGQSQSRPGVAHPWTPRPEQRETS